MDKGVEQETRLNPVDRIDGILKMALNMHIFNLT